MQVKKAGKDAWVTLSDALPQIRKEAAGDFSMSFDRAKEPVRASHVPGDDQPGKGRGKGAERVETRTARPARRPQRDGDDLLPVMPEVLHQLHVCPASSWYAPYNQLNISISTVTLSL